MRAVRAFLLRLGAFFRRERWEADLDAELSSNLELHIEDNIRAGMSPEEARRAALLRFGGLTATKDEYRGRKLIPSLDHLFRDVRYAARSLRRSKGFSLAVIATLALCSGANVTMLSALYSLVFKPLPVRDPERLVQLRPAGAASHWDSARWVVAGRVKVEPLSSAASGAFRTMVPFWPEDGLTDRAEASGYHFTNSTRRFFARPSSPSLGAAGA